MSELDSKKALLVALILLVLIAFAWYNFFYKDKSMEINRLKEKIAELSKYKRELPVLLVQYKKAQKEFKVYSKRLPLKEEIPSLLVRLNSIIKRQGVDLLSFKPRRAYLAKNGLYYIKPINISIRASYVKCGSVFERVAKMKRLFRVIDFTLDNPKIVGTNRVLINVNFSAETYYFKGKVR